jgi:ABC-2 type transport system permease protein
VDNQAAKLLQTRAFQNKSIKTFQRAGTYVVEVEEESADGVYVVTGYVGSFLMGGAYLAITAMTSAMTRNQVVAFIVSVVLSLFLILAGYPPVTNMLVHWASPSLVDAIAAFSVMTHFESIQKGVLDSRDILYFLSVIVFSLFTTGVIVRTHRAG